MPNNSDFDSTVVTLHLTMDVIQKLLAPDEPVDESKIDQATDRLKAHLSNLLAQRKANHGVANTPNVNVDDVVTQLRNVITTMDCSIKPGQPAPPSPPCPPP